MSKVSLDLPKELYEEYKRIMALRGIKIKYAMHKLTIAGMISEIQKYKTTQKEETNENPTEN